MGLDLTAFNPVLKDDYRPIIISLLNQDAPVLGMFTKDADIDQSDGRQKVYPAHLERNQGVGSVSESGNLPIAGNQGTAQVQVPYRWTYGRIQLTAQTIKASKTNKGAFKRAMTLEMDNLINDMKRLRNRQLWGWGVGMLARVDGQQTTSTTITLKDPLGIPGSINGCRYIQKNMWIAFVRNATPTSATDADIQAVKKVSSVNADGTIVTLTAATGATLNDNDFVVLAPAGSDNTAECSVNKEPMGLLGLDDDGTYLTTLHNISRSTYEQYKSSVISLNGDFSLDVMQRAADLAAEKSGGRITNILSHYSVRREYEKKLVLIKRYVEKGAGSPDLGFEKQGDGLEWSGETWKADRMAPYGMIFGIDKSPLVRFVNCEGEWADEDGTVLMRTSNKDIYEGRFRIFENFQNDRPDRSFRIDGVNATVDVTPVE